MAQPLAGNPQAFQKGLRRWRRTTSGSRPVSRICSGVSADNSCRQRARHSHSHKRLIGLDDNDAGGCPVRAVGSERAIESLGTGQSPYADAARLRPEM